MADSIQTAKISCRGGLDLRSTTQDLLQKPGFAIDLTNYEQNIGGGYRRINGFTKVTENVLPGSGQIEGTALYNNGYVMCRGDAVYFSFDGDTWEQVNKDVSTLSNQATLQAAAALPRTGATVYTFDTFTQGAAAGRIDLLIHSDVGIPAVLTIMGSSLGTAQYRYVEITSGGITDTGYGLVHNDQHVVAGDPQEPSTFYVSTTSDMEDFTTGQSGAYSVADPIVGLKSFRDIIYIFCENSIWQATGLNTGTASIQPVTRDVGCVDGHTIQEIGGDLIFLANDGLRTLGATARIDDVELSTTSLLINELLQDILNTKSNLQFTSCVIKSKNQYRLFYTNAAKVAEEQEGLIATFYPNQETGQSWSFSKLKGIESTAITHGELNGQERGVHGDISGGLYMHDDGNTFDGTEIESSFQTPYFDFGDSGVRKNLHDIILYLNPEGPVTLEIALSYDYEDINTTHQPFAYTVDQIDAPAVYGQAVYGTDSYGARLLPTTKVNTQGSGFTASYRFTTVGEAAPFTIQGFNVNFMASGRI